MTAAGAHWAMREHVTDTIWIKDKRLIPSLLIFYFHDFIFSAIAPIFNLNFPLKLASSASLVPSRG